MIRIKWLLALTAIISAPAAAAPTYLKCNFASGNWSLTVEMSLDEANQAATVSIPETGRVVSRTALFSPSQVKVFDQESTWIIDRVSLNIQREVLIGQNKSTNDGKCALQSPPEKRAF